MPTLPKPIDVVLVNPASHAQAYQALGSELSAIEPPIWAGLMATYLRLKGIQVVVLDAAAEGLAADQAAERLRALKPLLVAVVVYGHQPSASTQNMPAAGAVCRAVKQASPEQRVILVGGHVAALPEQTLREEAADFVCSGEGPVTLAQLTEALRAGSRTNLTDVAGLLFWQGDQIRMNPPAPLIRDLDREMPGVAWDLLPMDRYRAHNWHCLDGLERQPYAAIYTTLGCPFRCSFCCIQAPFKAGEKAAGFKEGVNTYRLWSPQAVLAELDTLANQYGVRNVKFADELFVLNPKHVSEICDGIIERGLDLNIWAYARVDTVRDDMLPKLKAAGINWLAYGIEAANTNVRDNVQKGFDQRDIKKTLEKTWAAGIHVIGNYIFGLPEDDLNTMQETLNLALELNCEFANFYSAMAYPGSDLYQTAVREGWSLPERWSGYSQHSADCLPLPTKHLAAAEVLEFRDHSFQTYYSSPRYLERVRQKFGDETVTHIRQMASHRLTRNHVPQRQEEVLS